MILHVRFNVTGGPHCQVAYRNSGNFKSRLIHQNVIKPSNSSSATKSYLYLLFGVAKAKHMSQEGYKKPAEGVDVRRGAPHSPEVNEINSQRRSRTNSGFSRSRSAN
jgi:hypothetical protein